jgi:hypothetical protein
MEQQLLPRPSIFYILTWACPVNNHEVSQTPGNNLVLDACVAAQIYVGDVLMWSELYLAEVNG